MYLRYLAACTHVTFRAKYLAELLKGLDHAARRLVYYHRAWFCGKFLEACLAAFLLWKEPLEAEAVVWQSRRDDSRYKCRRSRQRTYFDVVTDALPDDEESRIGDGRCSGIGDESDINVVRQHTLYNMVDGLMLVELMVGHQLVVNVEMLEQHA